MMNHLFTYVGIIKNTPESEYIVERNGCDELIEEQGIITQYVEQVIKFKNGVIIKQSIEQDMESSQSEGVCEESFIDYEVLFEPENYDITPKRKSFINHCQEAFWIKISNAQNI